MLQSQFQTSHAYDFSIIIPTLNEAENVEPLVYALERALDNRSYELVFVDDGSSDGTQEKIAALMDTRSNIRVIHRAEARGLSSAVIEGFLSSTSPVLAVIDADMQHDEAILPDLIDRISANLADLAVGTRYTPDGGFGDWSASRTMISRLATSLARPIMKQPLSDPMSGFFAINREKFLEALPRLSSIGFKILLDIVASSRGKLRIAEIPYTFRSRNAGESKLDGSVMRDYALLLIDKAVGRVIPARMVMFAAVGSLGVFVHLGVLRTGLDVLGLPFRLAQTMAVMLAIAFNFSLNNSLTYRDRRLHGRAWFRGLISFYIVCGLGAVANVGVGSVLFANHHRWWVAGVAGAVVGSLWNYMASSLTTWRKTESTAKLL